MFRTRYLRNNRIAEDVASLLDFWAGGINSGLNLVQAMRLSIHEAPVYLVEGVQRLISLYELGVGWREAFNQWEIRKTCPEIQLVGAVVEVSESVGTDLSTALKRIALIIRTNQQIKRELNAMTVQSRLTCVLLISIPPGLVVIINAVTPDFIAPLWHTFSGRAALGIAGCLQLLGVLILTKMLHVKWLM
ncbi:MAG: hypothetical protein GX058_00385 [Firmicutes bacterium]|nr:hypothetical protein [Bacillota bacterium]